MRHADVPGARRAESSTRVTKRAEPAVGKRRAELQTRRTMVRVFGITMLVLALVVGLGTVYMYRHLNGNLTVIGQDQDILGQRPDKVFGSSGHDPINILVMGSDSRDCKGCALDKHTHDGQRSDTTILIHLSGDRKHAYGVSIPRDTIVDRPRCKETSGGVAPAAPEQMFNTAFQIGGPACTISQVEHISHIRIDHYVVVDFSSFKSMVDAVGGVDVCIPEAVNDKAHNIELPAGTHKLSGDDALKYVRVRHGIGDGSDLSRTKRQQAFIGAMANAVLSSNTLANPVKVLKFLNAATKGLTVDPGLGDLKKLASLGYGFKDIGLNKIQFLTAPVGADPSDPNRVVLTSDAAKMWRKLRHDKPLGKELSSQSIRAGSLPGADKSGSSSSSDSAGSSDSSSAKKHHKKHAGAQVSDATREYNGLCT